MISSDRSAHDFCRIGHDCGYDCVWSVASEIETVTFRPAYHTILHHSRLISVQFTSNYLYGNSHIPFQFITTVCDSNPLLSNVTHSEDSEVPILTTVAAFSQHQK